MTYYIIRWNNHETTVYDTQDIIKITCDLVNGAGVDLDGIQIITVENGKATRTGVI